MSKSLLRPTVIGILLLTLVSFAQHPPASLAQGSTDNVQPIDLAKMVFPLSAFGPDYAALQQDPQPGFASTDNRQPGELAGYSLSFGNRSENPSGPVLAGSAAVLLDSSANAAATRQCSLTSTASS